MKLTETAIENIRVIYEEVKKDLPSGSRVDRLSLVCKLYQQRFHKGIDHGDIERAFRVLVNKKVDEDFRAMFQI
jgi:hypothetical protein